MKYMDTHDNTLNSYEVDIDKQMLILHTTAENSAKVDAKFIGVLSHRFEDVELRNIIFDIEDVSIETFIQLYSSEIPKWLKSGFPISVENSDELYARLTENGHKAFLIFSSLGLSGFVIAKELFIG